MSLFKLAFCDLRFARGMSWCIVFALGAILTPLLLIFSLRTGVVAQLERELTQNPASLEIIMVANYKLDADFIESLRQDPKVGFVVPLTRSLSVTCNIRATAGRALGIMAVPTAAGDPVLKAAGFAADGTVLQDTELYLSAALADKIKVQAGDSVTLSAPRIKDGRSEAGRAQFMVKGVVDRAFLPGERVLISLDALIALEDYRDGFEPAIFSDGSYLNEKRRDFAKVRLYASDIYSVEPLVKELEPHYRISSHLAEIENLKAVSTVLAVIAEVIAVVTVAGGIGALWGLISSSLALKQKSFAMLRLLGFTPWQIYLLCWCEQLLLSTAGFILSALLCLAGSALFNHIFAAYLQGAALSFLTWDQWLGFFAVSALILCVLTALAVRRQLLAAPVAEIMRLQ